MPRIPRGQRRVSPLPYAILAVTCLAVAACAKPKVVSFEPVRLPPPRIDSVAHGAPDGARPGDDVSITLKGDPGLKASASLGAIASLITLGEDSSEQGLYRGRVRIPDGKTGTFELTGRLEADPNRFSLLTGPSLRVTLPPPPPPDLTKHELTATDFNAQKVLKPIYFDFDRHSLRPDARETLAANADRLKGWPHLKLLIEGHCDERGTNEYNLALGDSRANAARDYLVNSGIEAGRIRTISYGEERPAETGRGEAAWTKNRRAEFVLEE